METLQKKILIYNLKLNKEKSRLKNSIKNGNIYGVPIA